MGKAVRHVSEQVKIPGFRPGKAPREVVERTVGRPALLQEALDHLLPEIYNEALESEEIDAIAQPEFELESTEPLIVNAKVPVRPTVELNEYSSLRAPRESVEATEEQVEESIVTLRRRFATLEPADRAIDWGDTVRADVTVSVGDQKEPHVEEDAEFRVAQDAVVSLPGFVEELIGLERGGPYDISFELPEDFDAAELAGKTASYTVKVHEVKQEVLPDLDDEFVVSLDEDGVETVDALHKRMQESVEEQVQANALSEYQDEVLDLLLANAEIDYPEVLVEQDIDRLIDQQSNHASHTQEDLDRWLQMIGKTEQELRDELRDTSDLNVRRSLVLAELIDREKIEVPEGAVEEEIDRMVDQMGGGLPEDADEEQAATQRETVRNLFDTAESRASMEQGLITHAALDALVAICEQEDDGTAETAPATRGSRRQRGSRRSGGAAAAGAASEAADEPASGTAETDTDESSDADNDEAGDPD
jgi:trigger factor